MPQNFEEKYPNNGMNRDDESRYLETNDSRYILNTRAGSSEDNNVGAIENIKGTTEVSFDLPAGRNVCIGSEGDQTTHSNFFFVWNSLGDHTIYRYFPISREVRILSRDSIWNFSEFDLINDINIVDDLIYFRDINNPPRKINFEKADIDDPDRKQVFNWYLGDEYLKGESILEIRVDARNSRYDPIALSSPAYFILNPLLTDKREIAEDLAAQINALSNVGLKASSCGEFVSIEVTVAGYVTITALKGGVETSQIVPQNHYQSFIDRTIDVIKHPPHCEIKASYQTDEGLNRNYVEKKVFQFAARYIYDDDEKTTVNPHSVHIYNQLLCDQFTGNNLSNYIEVDFSVLPELNDPESLQTIRQLELFVREGELGVWKSIKVLEQFEFVDVSNQHYDFYNDGIYDIVDPEDFVRPYDLVPQRTKNQDVAKNRVFYANNLEGYDNTCLDANINLTYDDVESRIKPPTYTIRGRIDIRAAFNGGSNGALKDHQPIWRDNIGDEHGTEVNPIVFGGLSSVSANPSSPIGPIGGRDKDMEDIAVKTGQILPLGGFTVYLAGTDYYAISNQRGGADGDDPGVYSGLSQVSQDTKGVFNGSGGDYVGHVREYAGNTKENYGELYSTFEIQNVPDGWYSLRIASHQTTQAEIDDGSRSYQKTSTNAFNFTGSGFSTEEKVGLHEILVHVQGGDIGGIHANVMDLSHVTRSGSSKILSGYVVDSDITASVSDFNTAIGDTRISRALVSFDKTAHNPRHLNILSPQHTPKDEINDWAYNYWIQDEEPRSFVTEIDVRTDASKTDHNGFFFFASIISRFFDPYLSDGKLSIKNIRPLDHALDIGAYNGTLYGQNGGVTADVEEDSFTVVASRTGKDTEKYRAWIKGKVLDGSGLGVVKASIVSQRVPASQTDFGGDYAFWHYGIKEGGVYHTLLFPSQSGQTCSALYSNQLYVFNFDFGTYSSGLGSTPPNTTGTSPTLEITVPSFEGDTSAMKTINSDKRGGDYSYGIEYTDRGMRSGAVNTSEKLNLHIPFYTEKDENGLLHAGVPILNWEVKHRPPAWATHWQWVRTRNTTIGSYFQWALGDVTYEDSEGNPATYSTGTRVVLSYANLLIYLAQNPSLDFQMGISVESTRVRFIKNKDGVYFDDYYDFKVLSGREGAVVIEKDFSVGELVPGVLVEFYNEVLDIEEDIYYEFGECFEVKESNGVKYHGGLTQDQDPLLPSTTPATGVFRTGDAYYRLRGFPAVTLNTPSFIDDDAVSDFYLSEVESIGRPNVVDPDAAQIWKPNQIRHSLKYIPDTKINGFSTFYALNFQALPIEYGDINKLQLAANVLMSIHEFRWVSNYIEESIMRKQGGADELVATTDVFGSFRAAKDISGTINQESVIEYKGNVYAFDKNKGLVNRWGSDGLTTISNYKMTDYFSDKAKEILNTNKGDYKNHKILGVYDPKFNEYILSFGDIATSGVSEDVQASSIMKLDVDNSQTIEDVLNDTLYSVKGDKSQGSILIFDELTSPDLKGVQVDNRLDSSGVLRLKVKRSNGVLEDVVRLEQGQGISDFDISTMRYSTKRLPIKDLSDSDKPEPVAEVIFKGETVSFSEKLKRWITFYSFKPEMFGVIDLEMISFTEGKLWIHNDNILRNNFYGIQYPSQVETVFNSLPEKVKVFQSVGAESYHPWSVPSAKTPNGRETEMVSARFVRREDSFFSSVMRDKNDPAFTGKDPEEAIINGRQLRDRSITVLFENGESEEVVLYSLSMLGTLSSRHQK